MPSDGDPAATRRRTPRRAALATVTLLLVGLAAFAPAPAAAAESCDRQVFLDWWDNNRIDRIYPLHCYREAIDSLPVDIRQYSRAEDDISRALAYAFQHKPDPGDRGEGARADRAAGNGVPTGAGFTPSNLTPPPAEAAGPAAVPLPLIVLASLACLFLLLGAGSYLRRRLAERGGGTLE